MKIDDILRIKLDLSKAQFAAGKENYIEPNPCEEGYEAIGLKEKDGRMVPNCVPIKKDMSVKKEGFPIPSPESSEDQDAFISRCVKGIIDEYGQEQSLGICYAQWEKK